MDKPSVNQQLDSLSAGFGAAFFVTSIVNALLVVGKETYAPLKAGMKSLFGHHWTTHGIAVIALFILLGYVFAKTGLAKKIDAARTIGLVLAGTVLGGLIIMAFYSRHLFD